MKTAETNRIIEGNKEIIIRANGTKRVRTINTEPSLTEQQHYPLETDVNKILERYHKTGTLQYRANAAAGVYADLTTRPNLQEAMNTVAQANSAFEELPALLRLKFENNPQKMIEFLQDEKNTDEAIKLGLVVPPQPKQEDPILNSLNNIEKNTKPKTKQKNDNLNDD